MRENDVTTGKAREPLLRVQQRSSETQCSDGPQFYLEIATQSTLRFPIPQYTALVFKNSICQNGNEIWLPVHRAEVCNITRTAVIRVIMQQPLS